MNGTENQQHSVSDIEILQKKLDQTVLLPDKSKVNGLGNSVNKSKKVVSVNDYLKKLQTIKKSILENDFTTFKNSLKDLEPADEVVKSVSHSMSSQIRIITADLMHDCISMPNREPYIAGLAKVFNINEENKLGFIPLHLAAARGKLTIVSLLIRQGSEVNMQNEQGRSPLHIAVLKGHLEVVHYLLCNGADPNVQDQEKWTPLHWACRQHNLVLIRILVLGGSRLDLKTDRGRYALDMAFGANHNPSEITWHPMSAWNLIVHGACHVSHDIVDHWITVLLPKLELPDDYRLVLSQLLLLMYKAGLLPVSWVEPHGIACQYLKEEHLDEARYWCAKPAPLAQQCRLQMRKILLSAANGRSITEAVNKLSLPKGYVHFILLKK